MTTSNTALADALVHRRANFARLMAMLLVTTQATTFSFGSDTHGLMLAQQGAWVIWVLVLFAFIGFGSGLVRGPAIRAALNDESTIAHRRCAFALGFWVALAISGLLWVLAMTRTVPAAQALRLVVSLSVAVALLRFATLEKRALVGE